MNVLRLTLIAFVLPLCFLLSPSKGNITLGTLCHAAPSMDLRVEDLSIQKLKGNSSQITISFRVVNDGPASVTTGFRTSIFPGEIVLTANGKYKFLTYYVNTAELPSQKVVFISRTINVPGGVDQFDVQIEADADHVVNDVNRGNNKAAYHFSKLFVNPHRWESIGPTRITSPPVPELHIGQYDAVGRLTAVAIHPSNSDIIYVGSPGELGHEGCGVWKTMDGGKSWAPVADSLPTLAIAAIAIDPTNPNRIYIATPDNGIFRSEDAGTSWINVHEGDLKVRRNTGDIGDRTVLLVDPVNPEVLFLTTDKGVLRSQNSGVDWSLPPSLPVITPVGDGTFTKGSATSLVMDPWDHEVLYAGIQEYGVYRTVNGGADWVLQDNITRQPVVPSAILLGLSHVSPSSPTVVYALFKGVDPDPAAYNLFRTAISTMTGDSIWENRGSCNPSDECKFWIMAVDPGNANIVYLGGPSLFVSHTGELDLSIGRVPDFGKEDRQPDAPHGDYHGWAFNPKDPKIVYAATDGGIYRSTNQAIPGTWLFIGEGITNAEVYDLADAATLPGRLIAGTQDNGTIQYDGSPVWRHIYPQPASGTCAGCGGDGGIVAIDPNYPDTFYAMGQSAQSLVQSMDGGMTFSDFPLSTDSKCYAYNQSFYFQTHPSTSGLLIASCRTLWLGLSLFPPLSGIWTSVYTPPSGRGSVVRSAVDAANNLYYAGTSWGWLYAGLGAANFQEIFSYPIILQVSDIEVDPADAKTIYASFAPITEIDRDCSEGSVNGRIYRLRRLSPTPSTSTMIATDITGNLPADLCVNAVAVDPYFHNTLYAGTSKGVFRGHRVGIMRGFFQETWSWEPYDSGMPPADVRDLEVDPTTGRMYAATYGRGVFEVILPPLRSRQGL